MDPILDRKTLFVELVGIVALQAIFSLSQHYKTVYFRNYHLSKPLEIQAPGPQFGEEGGERIGFGEGEYEHCNRMFTEVNEQSNYDYNFTFFAL